MDYKPKKLFTIEQANKMLPLVRRIAEDVQRAYRKYTDVCARYQEICPGGIESLDAMHSEEVADLYQQVEQAKDEVLRFAGELEELGVLLKGPDNGLLDFPSLRDGQVVFLCWMLGEDQVEYWHEIEAGFAGRQPLELPTGRSKLIKT